MSDHYDKDLKKFETDILVKRIMDRKWYETQALVAATKEHSVNPRIDIIKRKRELLKLFLTEREEVDQKKIDEYRETIFIKKMTALRIENEQVNKIIPEEIEVRPVDVYVEEMDIGGVINDEENSIFKNAKGKEEFEIIKDEEEERRIRIIQKEEEERKRKIKKREEEIQKEEEQRKKEIENREQQIIEEKKRREEEYKRKEETDRLMRKIHSHVDINMYLDRINRTEKEQKSTEEEKDKKIEGGTTTVKRNSLFGLFRNTVTNTINLFRRKKVIEAYESHRNAEDEYNRAIELEKYKKSKEEKRETRNEKLEKNFGTSFWGIINHKQAQKETEERETVQKQQVTERFEPRYY